MTKLQLAIRDYLALRRALGFKLRLHGPKLQDFASFLARKRSDDITTALALEWATQPQHHHPSLWSARLSMVRGFARHHSATDPATEIPPWGLLPFRPPRARPYLYSAHEVCCLLEAARARPSPHSLSSLTHYCFFGLLAVTGMRVSEAINLLNRDVDWSEGILTIRDAKLGKSRLVPLHPSTRKVLANYVRQRDDIFPPRPDSHLLVNQRGRRLDSGTLRRIFYALSRQIGLRPVSARRGPRLHDFRHRFATDTLLRWYRKGDDATRRLPVLATYLGHAHIADTYWYLTSTPELLGAAGQRLEKRWGVSHATAR
jgi:integrase/recombinase XerD